MYRCFANHRFVSVVRCLRLIECVGDAAVNPAGTRLLVGDVSGHLLVCLCAFTLVLCRAILQPSVYTNCSSVNFLVYGERLRCVAVRHC